VRRAEWRRFAAPAAFLLAVTLAVLLIRSGLESGATTSTTSSRTTTGRKPVETTTTTSRTTTRTRTTTTTAAGKRYWTVRPGDTFGVISSQSGVSVAELTRLNPNVSPTSLFIGERIRIR
jgi:LysM repeat protein